MKTCLLVLKYHFDIELQSPKEMVSLILFSSFLFSDRVENEWWYWRTTKTQYVHSNISRKTQEHVISHPLSTWSHQNLMRSICTSNFHLSNQFHPEALLSFSAVLTSALAPQINAESAHQQIQNLPFYFSTIRVIFSIIHKLR